MNIRIVIFCLLAALGGITTGNARNHISVSKKECFLYVVTERGDTLCKMPCAVGRHLGQKTKKGDMKTPEGVFTISKIQNSKTWTHDFKDGAGERAGAYGPWFIRLNVPRFTGIGIHGTCFPESIGTHCTEGCVRLNNEDLLKLVKLIKVGDIVKIEKDI